MCGIKNGYSKNFKPPKSHYRDLKVIVRFPLPRDVKIQFKIMPKGTKLVAEIQLLLSRYLKNKLTTSTGSQKRRACSLKTNFLLRPFLFFLAFSSFSNTLTPFHLSFSRRQENSSLTGYKVRRRFCRLGFASSRGPFLR